MFEAKVHRIVGRGATSDHCDVSTGQCSRIAKATGMRLVQLDVRPVHVRHPRPVVRPRRANQMPGPVRASGRLDVPRIIGATGSRRERAQIHCAGQVEAIDPCLDVVANARLVLASDGQVAERPVGAALLNVLPGRELRPRPADHVLALQKQRIEPSLACVKQSQHAANPGPDDDDVQWRIGWHVRTQVRPEGAIQARNDGGRPRKSRRGDR